MKLIIKYFASLAEARGLEEETLHLEAPLTAERLYAIQREKYGFSFDESKIRVALNHQYADFEDELKDGDTIVFIPPVSGG